ncbi:MAG: L-seryl-tRNA(Sec) selenium transferase [Anaerolineales bacterium]|nr:MAG: L-seryl-tRNA(Sec) selenium transferase [Anaerolineales bacterium]
MTSTKLRRLPSVDRVLGFESVQELIDAYGRQQTVNMVRETLDAVRGEMQSGADLPPKDVLVDRCRQALQARLAATLRPVINATGVILHTNLGRAPLSAAARAAVSEVSQGYSTLEYDPDTGSRGHRDAHVERLVQAATGAEAAMVVNNNAAAVLLALTGLAKGQGVIISRGQLVEIGGGFRVPDVMAQSGARLIEVGTTNRTHLQDYAAAVKANEDAALLFVAHHSNFRIVGFATEPSLADLVALGNEHGLSVVYDVGSGALLDTAQFGLAHEPTVQEGLQDGAAIVCFSGDKLLGGPQAGIIVGPAAVVDQLKRYPLTRALRPDKLCLAALQATLLHYAKGEAAESIPVWRMISQPVEELGKRAQRWRRSLRQAGLEVDVIDGESTIGGGSLPGEKLPTKLVALSVERPDGLTAALRAADPPIIARIDEDRVVLDPRTVLVEQESQLLQAVKQIMESAE